MKVSNDVMGEILSNSSAIHHTVSISFSFEYFVVRKFKTQVFRKINLVSSFWVFTSL